MLKDFLLENLLFMISNLAGLFIILKPSKQVLQQLNNARKIIDKALIKVVKA